MIVCGWALLTKVFPGALAPDEMYARLREPFGYWNAVGLTAALGMPPLLWLGRAALRPRRGQRARLARRSALLDVALLLSYSRGALLALAVGLAFWFAVVPLRLRGALAAARRAARSRRRSIGVGVRARRADDRQRAAGRARRTPATSSARCSCWWRRCCWSPGWPSASSPPSARRRRARGGSPAGVLVGVLALVPVALVIALAAAPGGIDGQVSKAWDKLTDPNAADADQHAGPPDRDVVGARALLGARR